MSDLYYGSNVASGVLTSADLMALNTTGGTETSKTTTAPSDFSNTNWMEILSQGGTGTDAASIPAPTGKGWISGTQLEGQTIPAGNWSASIGISDASTSPVYTLTIRFYKRSSGGTYTSIGTITASSQSIGASRTVISFSATSMGSVAFATGDKLYVDLFAQDTSAPGWNGNSVLIYISNSSTAGVANDLQITTPTHASSGTQATKSLGVRLRLAVRNTRSLGTRLRLAVRTTKSLGVRFLLGYGHTVSLPVRLRLMVRNTRSLGLRLRLAAKSTRSLPLRLRLNSGIATGGFCLYANGTGVASFDDFRVTQFPDPSLALEPVGRLGSSFVSWNANLPGVATTLSMYTSLRGDGTDWIDVSAQNGGPIPGLYGQPDPTIDGFDTATTLANYTMSHNNGLSDGTWTVNTAKSRVEVTGGAEPVLIYSGIARADMYVETITDQAPGNGMGLSCRWQDGNNTYNLYIQDSISLSPNTWQLYKIVAGTYTLLASGSLIFPRGTFHVFRLSTIGSTISALMDGAQLTSVTDTSITGAGQAGLIGGHGTDLQRFYSLRIQPQGDSLLNTYVYTKQVEASTDATLTPQLLDMTIGAFDPNIGPGALIPGVDNRKKFGDKVLDDAAQQSGDYSWFIDQNLQFHFNKRTVTPAPWVLYSVPFGVVGAVDLEADNQLKVTVANDLYRNRQTLLGVINSGTFSNTFIGNSQDTSFTLSYPLAPGFIPTIKLNGNLQSVALKGKTGAQWYYVPSDPVIAQDTSGTVLVSTDTLSVPLYTGTFEDTVTVDNVAAQAALKAVEVDGTGIVEAVEDVRGRNMTYAAGLVYAGQKLSRYCIKDARTMTFTTVRNGLAQGQILSVFVPEENLWDAQMLITGYDQTMQTQPNDTILYTYLVTVSELAPMASWSKLLAAGILLA